MKQPSNNLPLVYDLYGRALSSHDILTMPVTRWSPGKKYIMVQAVIRKVLTKEQVLETFRIGLEEFEGWMFGFQKDGVKGLQLSKIVDSARTRSGN